MKSIGFLFGLSESIVSIKGNRWNRGCGISVNSDIRLVCGWQFSLILNYNRTSAIQMDLKSSD